MKPILSYAANGHKTFDLDRLAEALGTDVRELKIRGMSIALSAVFDEATHMAATDAWDKKTFDFGTKPPTEKQVIEAAKLVFGFDQ